MSEPDLSTAVAVVGMAGRFPGAPDVDALWRVIDEGRDTLLRFPPGPEEEAEPDPEALRGSDYVRARGVLEGIEECDADFFGFTPAEAAGTDPQQRLWLEIAWEALEAAGYAHDAHRQVVGVYAGSFTNTYLLNNLLPDRAAVEEYVRMRRARSFARLVQNDPSFLPTRTAYKLDLTGPAVNVQTACSTSLVAVALGVRSLLAYEVDVALAGGVCIAIPQRSGYFYQEGAIQSRDGTCRPYDAAASGTVFGNGAAAVVLKRLQDAQRDGDPIRAILLGAALNNDGRAKVSFAAPGVQGQAEAIAAAQALAGVEPDTIGYVEGHGTGTPMGDPIEVEALTRAFRKRTARTGFCALGSIKGNIGHLDAAAGAAGLIRAVLALEHRQLPATAHFQSPNPELRLAQTPFFVCAQGRPWPRDGVPRRAAVSSFGIGGTNAHVILEEAPEAPASPRPADRPDPVVLLLSGKSPAALEANTRRLAEWVEARIASGTAPHPLPDVAHVLARRRQLFPHRRAVAASSWSDAAAALRAPGRHASGHAVEGSPKLFFVFPGQGGLRAGALSRLAAADGGFREQLAGPCALASERLRFDLLRWFADEAADLAPLRADNAKAQLALFCLDLALARWLEERGVRADGFAGHSLGEWVAAQLAGVVSLEAAVAAVHERGRLMQATGLGAGLIVRLAEAEAARYAQGPVALACVNGPQLALLSGPVAEMAACEARLRADGVSFRQAPLDVAVHSPAMDGVLEPFRTALSSLPLEPARRPFLSTVTGEWLQPAEAASADYWVQQIRRPVRFDQAAQRIFAEPCCVALEVGLGASLTGLLAARRSDKRRQRALSLLGSADEGQPYAGDRLQRALGELWANGLPLDLGPRGPAPGRAPVLPAYAFQRVRCWVDAPQPGSAQPVPARPEPAPLEAAASSPGAIKGLLVDTISKMARLPEAQLDGSVEFVALGLDSLFLTQLAEALRARLGIPVPFAVLVRNNSIDELAAWLEEQQRAKAAPTAAAPAPLPGRLVLLRPGDDRLPFLSIHGDRGDRYLPAYLPEGQGLHAYLHQGQDGERIELTRVEELAERCHADWLAVCGARPCVLSGHSLGGLVAYHVAWLRRQAGLPVALVVMLDAHHPGDFHERAAFSLRHPRKWASEVKALARRYLRFALAELTLRRGARIPPERRLDYLMAFMDRAVRLYEPPPLDADVLFFSAEQSPLFGRAHRRWKDLVRGSLEVHDVPGEHMTMVHDSAAFEIVGRELARRLAALRKGA